MHVRGLGGAGSGDLGEFRDLVVSAGAVEAALVTGARREPHPRHFVGAGKLAEIGERVTGAEADLVIFDHALSPSQERNLEQALQCRVLDRIGLILDIFAQRASTFEGQLQVELAQLRHLSTRLVRGWTHLERQKGGIGLRGPGEKQLETDRRLVAERIRQINHRLEGVRRRRELSRRARRKGDVPVVSLVGYTNAGKSTLFNRLTGADVASADRMFATLDPTLRRLALPGGPDVVLADTVGFIRELPTALVAAFRATLEETRNATLLLHVIDATDRDRAAKIEQVNRVLGEIGAEEVAQVLVYNKIDALRAQARSTVAPRRERDDSDRPARIWLSARTGAGTELLLDSVAEHLGSRRVSGRLRLPASAGRLRARLFELGAVVSEQVTANGDSVLDLSIRPGALQRLRREVGFPRGAVVEGFGEEVPPPHIAAVRQRP